MKRKEKYYDSFSFEEFCRHHYLLICMTILCTFTFYSAIHVNTFFLKLKLLNILSGTNNSKRHLDKL